MGKKKKRTKLPRNWDAVEAHFKTSAGPMKDRKKEYKKYKCRDKYGKYFDNIEEDEFILGCYKNTKFYNLKDLCDGY